MNGTSPIMLLTPVGCAWVLGVLVALTVLLHLFTGRFEDGLKIGFSGSVVLGGLLLAARMLRTSAGLAGTHLLMLPDELRIRQGRTDSITFRWEDITNVALRQERSGLWRLKFTLGSMVVRPSFYFRSDRGQATALHASIERRALEAKRR